jgi:hypothetical protein
MPRYWPTSGRLCGLRLIVGVVKKSRHKATPSLWGLAARGLGIKQLGPAEAGGLPAGPGCQTGAFGEDNGQGRICLFFVCRRLIHLEGTDALDLYYSQYGE